MSGVPGPKDISQGSLDMTLRDLLLHMLDGRMDHVVLVMRAEDIQITVTYTNAAKTALLTKAIARILP